MERRRKSSLLQLEKFNVYMIAFSMINVLILSAMVSVSGAAYLGMTLSLFYLISSVTSGWMTDFTARYLKGRTVRKQYVNANHFWKASFLYSILLNALIALIFFFFSDQISELCFRNVRVSLCVKLIGPALVLYSVLRSVFGYLKGMGVIRPIKFILLFQSILILVLSIFGVNIMGGYGQKVSDLLKDPNALYVYKAFGALSGGLIGLLGGCIMAGIFLLMFHREFVHLKEQDTTRFHESIQTDLKTVAIAGVFPAVHAISLRVFPFLNYTLYLYITNIGDTSDSIEMGGMYFGIMLPVLILFICLWLILEISMERSMVISLKNHDYNRLRENIHENILGCFALLLPLSVLLSILADAIVRIIGGNMQEQAITYLELGGAFVFGISLMIFLNRVLFLCGAASASTIFGFFSLLIQTICCTVSIATLDFAEKGIFFGTFIFVLLDCTMIFFYLKRNIHFSLVYLRSVTMNCIIALGCGFLIDLLYQNVCSAWEPVPALFVCTLFYFGIYLFLYKILRIVPMNELTQIPGGSLFYFIYHFLHHEETER